ncbi:MAG: hypothetical protein ACYCYO_11080 [Bacilli bacterium]
MDWSRPLGVSLPEALAWNSEVCAGKLANAWRQDGRRQGRRLDEVPDATDFVAALPDDAPMALRRASYYLGSDRRALYAWKAVTAPTHLRPPSRFIVMGVTDMKIPLATDGHVTGKRLAHGRL